MKSAKIIGILAFTLLGQVTMAQVFPGDRFIQPPIEGPTTGNEPAFDTTAYRNSKNREINRIIEEATARRRAERVLEYNNFIQGKEAVRNVSNIVNHPGFSIKDAEKLLMEEFGYTAKRIAMIKDPLNSNRPALYKLVWSIESEVRALNDKQQFAKLSGVSSKIQAIDLVANLKSLDAAKESLKVFREVEKNGVSVAAYFDNIPSKIPAAGTAEADELISNMAYGIRNIRSKSSVIFKKLAEMRINTGYPRIDGLIKIIGGAASLGVAGTALGAENSVDGSEVQDAATKPALGVDRNSPTTNVGGAAKWSQFQGASK